jgi:hypothetical protein
MDWLKPKTAGAKQLKYPAEVKARKQRPKRLKREIFSVSVVPELILSTQPRRYKGLFLCLWNRSPAYRR